VPHRDNMVDRCTTSLQELSYSAQIRTKLNPELNWIWQFKKHQTLNGALLSQCMSTTNQRPWWKLWKSGTVDVHREGRCLGRVLAPSQLWGSGSVTPENFCKYRWKSVQFDALLATSAPENVQLSVILRHQFEDVRSSKVAWKIDALATFTELTVPAV